MAVTQQLPEGGEQGGDIVEMQAGGGFVKEKEGALFTSPVGQMAGKFQALGLATAQSGHRLAEAQVAEAYIPERLQAVDDFGVRRKKGTGFADGQLQDLGNGSFRSLDCRLRQRHLQNLRPIAPAIAVGTAQVDVAQKLHLHVFETTAVTGGATAVAGVEAESAGGVTPGAGQFLRGKQFADRVEGTNVAGRIGTGGLADGRLIHQHNFT